VTLHNFFELGELDLKVLAKTGIEPPSLNYFKFMEEARWIQHLDAYQRKRKIING
jgi:hypothetical protein